ncbi:YcxB family protein [Alkalicella caledoniensis]|uniref:YcxB family protein n=1 Tax=Alkalicella caledoniensis TaxID=2731377 RepID=A0A7G9W9J2_ALKCA|nr:YcxB family protein [Alkalicella caledoniensis]QNO15354.1 YcxB family protein [Alkalicella caledoniensis]
MELMFEITEEDYIKFNMHHLENSPSQKKTFNLLRYIIPLLFSLPIYVIGTSLLKQPETYWIIIAVLFSAGWIIMYPNQYKRLIKQQTKKLLQEGDNSSIFGKKVMTINEKDIIVVSENSSEITSKENIKEVKIYDDMILIYLSGITAHIIPSRYLDEETKKELLEELSYSNKF